MQTRRQLMCSSPPPLGVKHFPGRAERCAVRRGGVPGVGARPSAGYAGSGGGAERWQLEVRA